MIRLTLALLGSLVGLVLVLPAVLLLLPFWAMAACVRLFARVTEPAAASGDALMRFDPMLGWRPKENLDAFYSAPDDDIYPIATDASGWPGDRPLSDSAMVVVGDSFAYGYGARRGETFWELAPELRIKPIGCPGYDMVQEMLALRALGPQLAGKLVCWMVYVENDIADSLRPHLRGYRKPFVRKSPSSGQWEVVTSHVRPDKWTHSGAGDLQNMKVLAALCSPGRVANYYYDACRFLIEEADALCRRHAATLAVVTVPNMNQLGRDGQEYLKSLLPDGAAFDPAYPDLRFSEACRELGVSFVAARTYLEPGDYKRFETFHWNRSGHRKMARLLHDVRASRDAACLRSQRQSSATPLREAAVGMPEPVTK